MSRTENYDEGIRELSCEEISMVSGGGAVDIEVRQSGGFLRTLAGWIGVSSNNEGGGWCDCGLRG